MNQLILVQGGEFIACEEVVYTPADAQDAGANSPTSPIVLPTLAATALLPVNTMRAIAVRLENELVPLPALRSQDRKVITRRIRLEGPVATRIARALGLEANPQSAAKALP